MSFDGVFRDVSPAWTAVLGHGTREIVGRKASEFVLPDDVDAERAALTTAMTRTESDALENRYRHLDGTYRWISWHSSAEGELLYRTGRDITEAKAASAALAVARNTLIHLQKLHSVGQLTAELAHDFNNLLAGIGGSLELANESALAGRSEDVRHYLASAQTSMARATGLTQQLLAFTRRKPLQASVCGLNRLVSDMEDFVQRTVGPAIRVEMVKAPGLWDVLIDANQFAGALLNLCINARDAMPNGGALMIETGNRWFDEPTAREREVPPGQHVSLSVSDTGIGMSSDVVARAFDPFFTTKTDGLGAGLGLSMIQDFANNAGGQARIYSEIGKGAMVCLYFPRHFGAAEMQTAGNKPARAKAEVPEPIWGSGETVLVVEDEASIRMVVNQVLTDHGYNSIEAADARAGLQLLQSEAVIDLLVTDVGLPGGINGRQMAEAARQLRPDLKVLFITGYAENAVLSHGHLERGMEILTKPFPTMELASRVRELLQRQ